MGLKRARQDWFSQGVICWALSSRPVDGRLAQQEARAVMTLRHAIAAITSATLLLPTIGAAEAKKIKRDGDKIVSERYNLFERRDDDFPAMRFRQDRSPDLIQG